MLVSSMQLDTMSETVLATIVLEGLRTGVNQSEVLWVHLTAFRRLLMSS